MKVLVTGGLGFIGSHVVVELQNEGFEVVIIDNLSNASLSVLDGIFAITGKTPVFVNLDLKNKKDVSLFFKQHQDFVGIIHFAASKAVGESVENPLMYYENNVNTLVYLLQELQHNKNVPFIFSSSCSVYGDAHVLPISETETVKPAMSPYGNTKQISETIIKDVCKVTPNFNAISLRYFNPIGAHESLNIGELPIGKPQNLVPIITQTAIGLIDELLVYGNNYPTKDGTCVRDYIHVVDVAKAHVLALKRLTQSKNTSNYEVFNIGSGNGTTVLELINAFETVTKQKLNYKIVGKRSGDVVAAYANTNKANSILGWEATLSLASALKSAWEWEKKIRR